MKFWKFAPCTTGLITLISVTSGCSTANSELKRNIAYDGQFQCPPPGYQLVPIPGYAPPVLPPVVQPPVSLPPPVSPPPPNFGNDDFSHRDPWNNDATPSVPPIPASDGVEPDGSSFTVKCKSRGYGPASCLIWSQPWTDRSSGHVARVEARNATHSSPCEPGATFSWDDQQIYVNKGCGAEFQVFAARELSSTQAGCASSGYARQSCQVPGFRIKKLVLATQKPGTDCSPGNYGFLPDTDTIWVDHGCKALFNLFGIKTQ